MAFLLVMPPILKHLPAIINHAARKHLEVLICIKALEKL
jgi:hypothetical protein